MIPFVPSTRIFCPSLSKLVAFSMATTAGIPYSLATIAARELVLPSLPVPFFALFRRLEKNL